MDPNSVLRGPCCGRLVITALLQEALWGSAQGPHPHLTRSPRSDLYDTGDMCEFDVNEYITSFPLASHGAREPGLGLILALVIHGPCGEHSPGNLAFGISGSVLPGLNCRLTLTPEPPGEGAGPELTDSRGP